MTELPPRSMKIIYDPASERDVPFHPLLYSSLTLEIVSLLVSAHPPEPVERLCVFPLPARMTLPFSSPNI